MKRQPIYALLIPLLAGICVKLAFFQNESLIVWETVFVVSMICIFCLSFFKSRSNTPQLIKFLFFSLLLFAFGILRTNTSDGLSEKHISNNYLRGDLITAKVIEHQKTKGKVDLVVFKTIRVSSRTNRNSEGYFMAFIEPLEKKIQLDDILQLRGDLKEISSNLNPGGFDAKRFWQTKKVFHGMFVSAENWCKIGVTSHGSNYYFSTWRRKLCDIFAKFLSGQQLAIVQGIVLGDRSLVSEETSKGFSDTGAMHVLAVSGMHIGILLLFLEFILGKLRIFKTARRSTIFCLCFIWFYCLLTGFSASVARCALMFSFLAIGKLLERDYRDLNILGASAFFLLIWEPYYLFDIGFQLSYLAMFGIFWFYEPISKLWSPKYKITRMAWEGTAVGLAAQLLTVPLSLYYFHQFPNYFALTNLGLMIYSFLLLALGLALLAFNFIPFLNIILAFCLSFSVTTMLWILFAIQKLPGSVSYGFQVNSIWLILIYVCIFILWLSYTYKKWNYLLIGSLAIGGLLITTLSFQRFIQLNTKKISVFDANQVIISIHLGRQKIILHTNYSEKKVKQMHKIIQGHDRLFPSNNTFITLPKWEKDSVSINSKIAQISIKKSKYGFNINKNGKFLFEIISKNTFVEDPKSNIVYMPWVRPTNKIKQKNNLPFEISVK